MVHRVSRVLGIGSLVAAALITLPAAQAQSFVAYSSPVGAVSNQFILQPIGMDFNVNSTIEVTRLGVFDSGQNGLAEIHGVRIYNLTDTTSPIISGSIPTGAAAELVGGDRFITLPTPVTLGVGNYCIVADINNTDGLYNSQGGPGLSTLNTGGGLITFTGSGRAFGGPIGGFPSSPDGGPNNRYLAGTFVFRAPGAAVPEPGTLALAGIGGVALLGFVRRTRSQK